jgi:multicomponent Na+:H+ antiporter subunit D
VRRFWPLWLFLWAALNALFQAGDVFNLYVTLELLGLSAVALVALTGSGPALWGAMRYLLVSLLGSLAYLLGVALLYHAYGTVDLALLGERADGGLQLAVPLGAMIAGLLLKTACSRSTSGCRRRMAARARRSARCCRPGRQGLVLPAAAAVVHLHARGRGTAGPARLTRRGGGVLGLDPGAAAAPAQAARRLLDRGAARLPVHRLSAGRVEPALAWGGSIYLALSHAFAKGAMFLAAGSIMTEGGHDEIDELDRVVERMPLTLAAFALAGISLAGLPPSGGFVGKWMLLQAAMEQGLWHWAWC